MKSGLWETSGGSVGVVQVKDDGGGRGKEMDSGYILEVVALDLEDKGRRDIKGSAE